MAESSVLITQRKSANGTNRPQRETLRSLGLRGIGRSVERRDGPELRGMIRAVSHLVEVSAPQESSAKSKREGGAAGG